MALSTFAIRVLGAGLAYLSQILLARWMGAHEYGIYSVAWTVIIVLGVFACIGFSSSPNRFIPQYDKTGDLPRLRGFLLTSRLSALVAATVLAGFGMLGVWLLRQTIEPFYVWPLIIILTALPLFALGGVQDGIARSYDWPSLAMLPTYIWRPLVIIGLVLGLILSGEPATAMTAAAAAVIATWLVAIYQVIALKRRLANKVQPGPRKIELSGWLAISLPMLMVEGFLQLITSADVIMVSFWHSPEEVAVYFAASKTLALVHFVYFAVRAASAHRFSGFVHSNDQTGLENYVRQATIWTFWPSLTAGIGLLLVAPLLLSLFGAGFGAGYPLIAVLLVGVLARSSVGPIDALLTMSGHQKSCALIYSATFAANVLLNLLLIPKFGLMGAAIATSASIIFEATCLSITAHRKLQIRTFILFSKADNKGSTR
ncbi:lipopolysaccharide biosynthesis protein [Roseibium algae]